MCPKNIEITKLTRWKCVRIIREEYECYGETSEEAKDFLASFGNPCRAKIVRERLTKIKTLTP